MVDIAILFRRHTLKRNKTNGDASFAVVQHTRSPLAVCRSYPWSIAERGSSCTPVPPSTS